jgi:mannose-6-phosphate isomerase-like protein (cupin superfamily)
MPRPHIEFIWEQDYEFKRIQLVSSLPFLKFKVLSEDTHNGAFTALTFLPHGWENHSPVAFNAAQEFFILDGQLTVTMRGVKTVMKPGCYLRVDAGVPFGPLSTWHSCRLLWMADQRLEAVNPESTPPWHRPEPGNDGITHVDTSQQEWEIPFVKGPDPGLMLKLLWMDPQTGAYSRLIAADKGWREDRLEHHDCVEEAYMLEGCMTMGDLGTMEKGTYFWRPPRIQHGPLHTTEGAVIFIRTDGPLHNYYTSADGVPLNY